MTTYAIWINSPVAGRSGWHCATAPDGRTSWASQAARFPNAEHAHSLARAMGLTHDTSVRRGRVTYYLAEIPG